MSQTLGTAALRPDDTGPQQAATAQQFVTFEMAGERFAVPMAPVQEIIRVPGVARLPLAPPALAGLANLRGRVLPIVDLRRMIGLEPREHDEATRALVIHLGQPLGFVVDHVASVLSLEPGQLEAAGSVRGIVRSEYLGGVIQRPQAGGGHELLQVLDFEALVRDQLDHGVGADARRDVAAAGTPEAAGAGAVAPSDELRLVSFTVCEQEYAIDIAVVREIVQVPADIIAVPNTPAHVLGLISLRGGLLPLVSLRSLFGLPALAADEQHRIVVVGLPDGSRVGLVTDAVKEVLGVPRALAEAVPPVLARDGALREFESICRLEDGRRLVSIIAADRLLGLQAFSDAAHAAREADTAAHAATDQDLEMSLATARHLDDGGDDAQVVVFRLGAEEFGVPIMSVQEIVRVPEMLTRVPGTPAFVEGVINLRGTVLPVIDQRSRLGMAPIERNDRQRIMVYMLHGQRTGFVVDSVAEVLRIPRRQIQPAPSLGGDQTRLVAEVARLDEDRRLVLLLDPDRLIDATETLAVETLQQAGTAPADGQEAAPVLARAA